MLQYFWTLVYVAPRKQCYKSHEAGEAKPNNLPTEHPVVPCQIEGQHDECYQAADVNRELNYAKIKLHSFHSAIVTTFIRLNDGLKQAGRLKVVCSEFPMNEQEHQQKDAES